MPTMPRRCERTTAQRWLTGTTLAATVCGCGAMMPPPPGAEPVARVAGPLPAGPRPPARPFPSLSVPPWSPPQWTAQDLTGFEAVLPVDAPIRVELAPELSAALWGEAATDWAEAWGARVHSTETVETPLWDDVERRRLSIDWLAEARRKPDKVALHLALDDESEVGAMVVAGRGCEQLAAAVRQVSDDARMEVAGFVAYADDVLWRVYQTQVAVWLPVWTEHASWMPESDPCRSARQKIVQRARACQVDREACTMAPTFAWSEGAAIRHPLAGGAVESDACAATGAADPVVELDGMAREAAEVAIEVFDQRWIAWIERLAAVSALESAVGAVCEPARRRFARGDLERARDELAILVEHLTGPHTQPGEWVPGSTVDVLAEYVSAPGSAASVVPQEAAAWAERVRTRARCVDTLERATLHATLVDVSGGTVEFEGRVFAEDLRCEDLPPRVGPT